MRWAMKGVVAGTALAAGVSGEETRFGMVCATQATPAVERGVAVLAAVARVRELQAGYPHTNGPAQASAFYVSTFEGNDAHRGRHQPNHGMADIGAGEGHAADAG